MSSQSERATFVQNVFINSTDKIKISISNLYYEDWNKLKAYFF